MELQTQVIHVIPEGGSGMELRTQVIHVTPEGVIEHRIGREPLSNKPVRYSMGHCALADTESATSACSTWLVSAAEVCTLR